MSRHDRIFEEMFETPAPGVGHWHVLVAADRPSADAEEATIVLDTEADRFVPDVVNGRLVWRKADASDNVTLVLSAPEARCLADMLLRAAAAIDPEERQYADRADDWWTVTPWVFAWQPVVGDRVIDHTRPGSHENGTVVFVSADRGLLGIAWDGGVVEDRAADTVEQIVEARIARDRDR